MVDAVIQIVLERLVPIIEKKVRDGVNLVLLDSTEEAASLASKLKRIQEVLDDAERRSITDRKVEAWLEKIKDAAYEMDDALDEWEAKIIEKEMEGLGFKDSVSDHCLKKVSSFIRSPCPCFKRVVDRRGITLKIKQLNGRLESIAKQINDEFNFLPNVHKTKDWDSHDIQRILTTSYFDVKDVSEIKGRDGEKNDIVSKLLSMRSRDDHHLQIISVVGTGGLGKTTLARLVFNDSGVKEYFGERIWVCVSDPFNEIRVANSILKSLTGNSQEERDFQILLERIEAFVSEKRILLVLDDVWEHDERKWNQLKNCLCNSGIGSRILVTTRNVRVAESMGSSQILPLPPLSDLECWFLLNQIAFQGEGNRDAKKQEIGREIAKMCKGLPLAAKTLGSLLRPKHSVQEWENVLKSQMWELEQVKVDLFPHLYLSYNELRPAVKRCFSYCATFPKDKKIKVDGLIRMWMAQGFLSSGSADEMELKGRHYVEDLAVRFFFQDLEKDVLGNISYCKMHDIIHDFAKFLTENECFVIKSVDDIKKSESSFKNARHLNWRYEEKSSGLVSMCDVEKLRSFRCKGNLPLRGLGTLERVRELSLFSCELEELSPEIGNLIHLRYLDLTNNPLRKLPRALCCLSHLQTLILEDCLKLLELPDEIHKLINLKHLFVSGNVAFPRGLEKLTCLKTLADFRVSSGGNKFRYLKNLKQLKQLSIIVDNLNEESDAIEASNAEMKNKNGLQVLALEFRGEVSMDVIEALQPPPYLLNLLLSGYVGFEFPRWVTTSLHNLKILSMTKCSSLPPLGTLQSLEVLLIYDMDEMECLGHKFLGITDGIVPKFDGRRAVVFPNLKRLWFSFCKEWTKWEDIGEEVEQNVFDSMDIMPRLNELYVSDCPNLKSLPQRLLHRIPLKQLNIYMSDLIIEQYRSRGGYQFLSPTCKVTIDSF